MRVKLDEGSFMPTRAHDTDAGLDLYAREDKVVPAGGSVTFDTGVHLELPFFETAKFYEVQVGKNIARYEPLPERYYTAGFLKSKSGLMVNHDITSDGTVDYGYTGSISIMERRAGR